MSEFVYFQKYHTKENVHSSNALYLLQRVYHYSPRIFFNFLESFCEQDVELFQPQFMLQEKGAHGITDFSISQESFKIVVEAKEHYNKFDFSQIERHLKDLSNFTQISTKILIALSPRKENKDLVIEEVIKILLEIL